MIPWEKIREDYISNNLSQRELSEKYHVSAGNIGKRASKEGWFKERERINQEARAKAAVLITDRKALAMISLSEAYQKMSVKCREIVAKLQGASIGEIESLARTLKIMITTAFILYKEPTISEEIARERLKLERERFDYEQQQDLPQEQEKVTINVIVPNEGDNMGITAEDLCS